MRRPGAERATTPPLDVRPPWPPSRRAQRPRRRRPGGRPRGSATARGSARRVGQAGFVGERKRRPGAERATTPPSRSALLCLIRAMHKGHAGVGRAGAGHAGGPRGGARLDSWGKGRGDPARSAPALVRGDPGRHRPSAAAERLIVCPSGLHNLYHHVTKRNSPSLVLPPPSFPPRDDVFVSE